VTSSWVFLSTLKYDARSTAHQMCLFIIIDLQSSVKFSTNSNTTTALFWDVTQNIMVFLTDVAGRTMDPKTLISYSQSILRNIAEERSSHPHRDGSLKS
jgi:hypothetical protein